MKQYLPLKPNSYKRTHLKTEFYYSKGGMNYWHGNVEPRGYYYLVNPVTTSEKSGFAFEEYSTDTIGTKFLIKEVSRKSKKAEAEAEAILDTQKDGFIELVLTKYGFELA